MHLPHQKEPQADKQDEGRPLKQECDVPGVILRRLGDDRHIALSKSIHQVGILHGVCLEGAAVFQNPVDIVPPDGDLGDLTAFHLGDKVAKLDVFVRGLARNAEEIKQQNHEEADNDPKNQVLSAGIHPFSSQYLPV